LLEIAPDIHEPQLLPAVRSAALLRILDHRLAARVDHPEHTALIDAV
jgi:hypothetical protein